MTTLAAPTGNEIQNTLAASYTRGTDTTVTLTDGAAFANSAHVIRITDSAKWCLIIYTTKATHVLTMGGGATDYALAKNVTVGDEAYEFPIGSTVELVCAADEIAQLFTEQALRTSAAAVVVDHSLVRGDGGARGVQDTGITVDDSDNLSMPDATYIKTDEVRALDGAGLKLYDAGGTKGLFVSDAGIITQEMQSSACAYPGTQAQTFPAAADYKVLYDTETWDRQNEMDITTKAGAADATEALKLHDADGGFAAADVGRTVWNTTDDTYAVVTAFVDSGELTLDTNIMANGETYILFASRFTVAEAGLYLITPLALLIGVKDGDIVFCKIRVDGATKSSHQQIMGGDGNFYVTMATTQDISASSYIEIYMRHDSAAARDNTTGIGNNNVVITKIA